MGLPNTWAYGLDISKYDETFDRSLSQHVIDFIIQRVSYAGTFGSKADEKLDSLYPSARAVQRRLAYHYFSGFRSVNEQFDTFMGAIASKDFHAYAVDFETMYNPQTAQSAKDCKALIVKIAQATGKRVLLYQQRHEWANFKQDWQGVDLWPKYWPYKTFIGSFDANATVERYWQHSGPYILQYGGDAFGVYGYGQANEWGVGFGTNRRNVDLDLFNGTPAEMDAWLGISNAPPPADPPTSDEKAARRDEVERVIVHEQERLTELG